MQRNRQRTFRDERMGDEAAHRGERKLSAVPPAIWRIESKERENERPHFHFGNTDISDLRFEIAVLHADDLVADDPYVPLQHKDGPDVVATNGHMFIAAEPSLLNGKIRQQLTVCEPDAHDLLWKQFRPGQFHAFLILHSVLIPSLVPGHLAERSIVQRWRRPLVSEGGLEANFPQTPDQFS